jgi:hypothetical protein
MDFKQGLICSLTGEKATFQNECAYFKLDETIKEEPLDDREGLLPDEIRRELSFETIEKLRLEQNLMKGIVSGLVVGIIGAILWATIAVATGYNFGYLALAIGAGVGLIIRKFGNGIDPIFGYWGGGISLLSVLLGNFLSIIGFIANSVGLGYMETLMAFDYSYFPEIMRETFTVFDIFCYGMAIFEGYKFSFRKITEKRIIELK